MKTANIPAPEAPATGDRLLSFATDVYGRKGVAEACLALQDEHGMDIAFLLFAAWVGAAFRLGLSDGQMAAVAASVAAWRAEVVAPLRVLRRRLKDGPAPAPDADTDALRDEIRRAELAAERIELAALERAAAALPAAGAGADAPSAVALNLRAAYGALAGRRPKDDAVRRLATLAEGALACEGLAP